MPITNARVLSPERVTIAGPAPDARIIETRPPVASAPILMPNPDQPSAANTARPVMVAAPTPDAIVLEAPPLPTTAPEQVEPEALPRRRRS